jgi:death-on-curing protein
VATDDDRQPLSDLLDRLPVSAAEREGFCRNDGRSVAVSIQVLTAASYYFNAFGVAEFGGRPGAVRDRRLVEQVIAAAFQSFGGVDPHPRPFDKAAMLLRGITQGHPFNDGNKRTGFLIAAYYLRIMDYQPPAAYRIGEVVNFCVRVSAGQIREIEVIADEIERVWSL